MQNVNVVPNNQRKRQRVYLGEAIDVIDLLKGCTVGEVVNITIEGLMLAMNEKAVPGNIYQFALSLPEAIDEQRVISLGADCLWASDNSIAGRHWAGFQVIDMSAQGEALVSTLIERYGIE